MSLVLLAWALGVAPAGANSGPPPGPAAAADPAFAAVLREVEERRARYEALEAVEVRLPQAALELGLSARMYRCWRLRLTGAKGRQARAFLERLASVQAGLRAARSGLAKDLLIYSAAPSTDPSLRERIADGAKTVEAGGASFERLLQSGLRQELVREERGLLGRRTVAARLQDDDYTMVYDGGAPECPDGGGR